MMAEQFHPKLGGLTILPTEVLARYPHAAARLPSADQVQCLTESAALRELCFCLLSPMTRYEHVRACIQRLERQGLLQRLSTCPSDVRSMQVRSLLEQLPGACRFPRQKAEWVKEAGELFYGDQSTGGITGFLNRQTSALAARKALAETVPGIGMKEASHFMRNIGLGKDMAVLDSHLRRFLTEMRIVDADTAASGSVSSYLRMERALGYLAFNAGLSMDALDLAIWEVMRER